MAPDITYLLSGVTFGLSAGLSPGPLLTLVISETLKYGIRAGIKVAVAPLLTDLPIVGITVFLLSHLADVEPVLGVVSLAGACFLAWLGFESIVFKGVELETSRLKPKSVQKGVAANFLNPSPYLFWLSIGGPLIIKAFDTGVMPVLWFVGGFYLFLVGAKMMLAVIVGNSRKFLKSTGYICTVRFLGIVLFGFMVMFLRDGLKYLNLCG